MTDTPQTWHYGLMAQWWSNFSLDASTEAPYFQSAIEAIGQPALDLACGTGRVLLPLLHAGLEVDGCDLSADMLAQCRERSAREGLAPGLFQQAAHELDLPRRYRTIYICDSFGIGGKREHDVAALRRCYEQLEPNGALLFNHYLPYDDPVLWNLWTPAGRGTLPQPWAESGRCRTAANGDEFEIIARIANFDPMQQRLTREMRITLRRDGQVVAQEENTLLGTEYFLQELLEMLSQAGFVDVTVQRAYTGLPATPDDTSVLLVARK